MKRNQYNMEFSDNDVRAFYVGDRKIKRRDRDSNTSVQLSWRCGPHSTGSDCSNNTISDSYCVIARRWAREDRRRFFKEFLFCDGRHREMNPWNPYFRSDNRS